MINKDTQMRELAYVVRIDAIEPIVGSDNCEAAVVGGWKVMVRKNTFKAGDLAIYFEIDSHVDTNKPEFAFLEKKHGNVKTQKYTFGGKNPGFYSQGLLMSAEDFGWDSLTEGDFLTEKLGVTYAVAEDNKRKGKGPDKYARMAQRMGKKFSKQPYRWLMQKDWGKKLLFVFFGTKKDKRSWPAWVVKTDEERVQNMSWILEDKSGWYATEKIDGTSTTFTMRGFGRKRDFYICSRNVCFDTPEKMANGAWYDTNVYQEMAIKYDIEKVLAEILDFNKNNLDFVTLQGETYGAGIQKRDYGMKNHDFMAFNLIFGYKDGHTERFNPEDMTNYLSKYNIPCVPIVDKKFVLPDTVDELLAIATDKSAVDGGMREGLVFRSADGVRSFKAVSNEFLVKYHQ